VAEQITTTSQVPVSSGDGGNIDFANLGPYILTKFVQVLEAALIIVIGIFLIRYAKRYLRKMVVEHEQQKTAINLLEKLVTGFLIVISITLALRVIGLDMTLLVSVSVLGLSYGLQDIIKNYVAGILIMFKSPFKIGDTIRIKDHTGKVDKIDFQATTLRTFDQKDVTIYNSDVMTQSITNFSRTPVRRVELDVNIGYGSDHVRMFKIFDKILENHASILKKPGHKIVFKKFNDNGITFSLRGWVNWPANTLAIKSDLALQISQAFNEEDIFIPFTKGVELDNDYTFTEKRKTRQSETAKNPLFAIDDASPLPGGGELIDFEELD
jgi:small conductance mechanosensitive channel